jgi:hypothetical protein
MAFISQNRGILSTSALFPEGLEKFSLTTWDEIRETNGAILVAADVANRRRVNGEHRDSTPEGLEMRRRGWRQKACK